MWRSSTKLRCCTRFVDRFLHHLVKWMDLQFTIMIGQSWCSYESVLALFLYHCYERPKWYYFILDPAHDQTILTMTYLMAPVAVTCWQLRDSKNMCHQKQGLTPPPYSSGVHKRTRRVSKVRWYLRMDLTMVVGGGWLRASHSCSLSHGTCQSCHPRSLKNVIELHAFFYHMCCVM